MYHDGAVHAPGDECGDFHFVYVVRGLLGVVERDERHRGQPEAEEPSNDYPSPLLTPPDDVFSLASVLPLALDLVKDDLAHTHMVGRNLDVLVRLDILQRVLEAED